MAKVKISELPKVTVLETTSPSHLRFLREDRCEMVKASCTTLKGGIRNRCSRFATIDYDGQKLCTQHAGELALRAIVAAHTDGDTVDIPDELAEGSE